MLEKIYLPKPPEGYCFACGSNNPNGLKMEFFIKDNTLYSETNVKKEHEGWYGISHGGIVCTILDETMSWTVLYFQRTFIVTKTMEVTFLRPVAVQDSYLCKGKILKSDTEEIKAQATLLNKEGKIMARSIGRFKVLSRMDMEALSPKDLRRMEEWFSKVGKLINPSSHERQ
mgnify:CR=1 FL=1